MALGILVVLGIGAGFVVTLAMSSEQSSAYDKRRQAALGLAESGLADAISRLINATDPSAAGALSPGSTALNGGTASYSGSLSGTTWTLTGTGSLAGAQPGAGAVARQVSQQFSVSVAGTPWEWATFVDQPSTCLTIRNNALVTTALYVNGNLCLSNNATYTASKLYVGGTLTNSGSVGSAGAPITSATIVGGCTGGSPNPHPCTAADRVYASTISQTPSTLSRPGVDLADAYSRAQPGPLAPCTVGTMPGGFDTDTTRNRSRPLFDLTPSFSYDCRSVDGTGTTIGQLTWNHVTSTLTAAGLVYFDGDISSSGGAIYTGRASIYASGTITFSIGSSFCGISGCSSSWDTTSNLILFVAGSSTDQYGFTLSNNAVVQAAVYAVNDVWVDNNAEQWGPVVARSIYIDNNASQSKPLVRIPPGSPGMSEFVRPITGTWRG